jgi:hypothetical protein
MSIRVKAQAHDDTAD